MLHIRLSAIPRWFASGSGGQRPGESADLLPRLSTIRFPLILMLVFFHNDRGEVFTRPLQTASPWLAAIVEWFAHGFDGVRVPTFFLIAGYVFFRSMQPTVTWFQSKIRSRGRSVLLPLLLWNLLGLASLSLAQQLPPMAALFNAQSLWSMPLTDLSTAQVATALFGTGQVQPLVYPLWFLHDLFLLALLTPAVYWAIKGSRGWITAVLALGWLIGLDPYVVEADALFFFVAGCHIAISRRSLFRLDAFGVAAVIVLLAIQLVEFEYVLGPLADKGKALVGVVMMLCVSRWLASGPATSQLLGKAAHYSFFIFVAHEPLLTVVRKAYFRLFAPASPAELLFAYFAIVALVLIGLIAAFELAERTIPSVLAYMTGGRSAARRSAA